MLNISPKLHNQGGSNTPYERYHLTNNQWREATQVCDASKNGLATASNSNGFTFGTVPEHPYSSGIEGQRAISGNRLYIYVQGIWKYINLIDL